MMSYHFKLEALRQYRCFQEETAQRELADTQRTHDRIADVLSQYMNLRYQAETEFKNQLKDSATGPHMSIYNTYLKRVSKDIETQRLKVAQAIQACAQKRQALMSATQKRKALDHLKEKDFESYLIDLNREEEKFINEMALNRFASNPK